MKPIRILHFSIFLSFLSLLCFLLAGEPSGIFIWLIVATFFMPISIILHKKFLELERIEVDSQESRKEPRIGELRMETKEKNFVSSTDPETLKTYSWAKRRRKRRRAQVDMK
jgi:hypothetical protein